jgi:hypothetical protein
MSIEASASRRDTTTTCRRAAQGTPSAERVSAYRRAMERVPRRSTATSIRVAVAERREVVGLDAHRGEADAANHREVRVATGERGEEGLEGVVAEVEVPGEVDDARGVDLGEAHRSFVSEHAREASARPSISAGISAKASGFVARGGFEIPR